jgi:hypothetical protein
MMRRLHYGVTFTGSSVTCTNRCDVEPSQGANSCRAIEAFANSSPRCGHRGTTSRGLGSPVFLFVLTKRGRAPSSKPVID